MMIIFGIYLIAMFWLFNFMLFVGWFAYRNYMKIANKRLLWFKDVWFWAQREYYEHAEVVTKPEGNVFLTFKANKASVMKIKSLK